MCGIAGIYYLNNRPPDSDARIARMTTALTHRGPDESGYHADRKVVLGHRRLSIIDLATGQQPLYNEDHTISVVFNGEIYNFMEIRKRLVDDGHVFRTHSDTETIVHAYEAWGERCVHAFRGMFAFAVRDEKNDTLFLARDRFGEKPLYYALYDNAFVFASEMKAILTDPRFERSIDEEALASYMLFAYVPAPLTIFKGIHKLRPGHVLTMKGGQLCEKQYWDLSFNTNRRRKESEVIGELNDRISEAVRARLVSDVPLGAFLSGGIDSSAVVAHMSLATSSPVRTFTIGFDGGAAVQDEREYAQMIASRYRTAHSEFDVNPDPAGLIESIVTSFDEPFADDSTIPSYFVCKIARQQVTVALSGLGGDEAFYGYERHLGFQMGHWFARVPPFLRTGIIQPLVDRLPEPHNGGGGWVNHAKRFVRSVVDDEARRYLGFVTKIAPAYREGLFGAAGQGVRAAMEPAQERFLDHYRNANADDPLDRVGYCDVKTALPDDLLTLTDRLSMRHSLEVRVPFLDHSLFEFAATIPVEMKIKWLQKKYLLKKGLSPLLPKPVLYHRKQGFVGPTSRWLKSELRAFTLDVLSQQNLSRHGLFDQATVGRILTDHFEGRETNDMLIWSLVMFQIWFDLYMDRGLRSPYTVH